MPSDDENDSVAIQAGDWFGQYVGIDEKHGVVGAPEQESLTNQDEEVDDGGWGHAFIRGSGVWSYNEFLGVSDPQEDGQLGSAVAMAGRTVVMGAPSFYESRNTDPGSVHIAVYDTICETWSGKFSGTGDEDNDYLGTSVATDDGVAVAGASTVTVDGNDWAGKAYVFTRDSSKGDRSMEPGDHIGRRQPRRSYSLFGSSAAVDDSTIVVGAPGENTYTGAVYVFTKNSQS